MAIAGSRNPVRDRFLTGLAWLVALIMFFPILWLGLSSIKTEDAATSAIPEIFPTFNQEYIRDRDQRLADGEDVSTWERMWFKPTVGAYVRLTQSADGFGKFIFNTVTISLGATLLGMLLAVPAAYSMAFRTTNWTKDILLWMLSTKMLPAVGVVVPIYLLFKNYQVPFIAFEWDWEFTSWSIGAILSDFWTSFTSFRLQGVEFQKLLDTRTGLVIVLALINLPILVWILFIFFKEIPKEILEASRMDGANTWGELRQVVLPLAWGGIASCALLSIIFAWNEAYWTIRLATKDASGVATMVNATIQNRDLFAAKLSAASMVAIAPIVVMGWFSQKQLVAGLSFGAVK